MKNQLYSNQPFHGRPYFIFFLLVITNLVSCNKGAVENIQLTSPNAGPGNPPMTIRVLEKLTNVPIEGAEIALQKCARYDNVFGCVSYSIFDVLHTNSAGEVTFIRPPDLEAYEVTHPNYWKAYESNGSVSSITLTPKCTLKINIERVNSYSQTTSLSLQIQEADCYSYNCSFGRYTLGLPADTVIYVPGFGNTNNRVIWSAGNTSQEMPLVFVNRFDTATINIQY
jgi:hypothetical protein